MSFVIQAAAVLEKKKDKFISRNSLNTDVALFQKSLTLVFKNSANPMLHDTHNTCQFFFTPP